MRLENPTPRLARCSLILSTWAALLGGTPALADTTGAIKGRVTQAEGGAPLGGVTVIVTSPSLQGELLEYTDDDGRYQATGLPPGTYLVRFYLDNVVAERPEVVLRAEQTLNVSISLEAAVPREPGADGASDTVTYQITARPPAVDIGSTQVITQVTSELLRGTPVRGRTYDSVATFAPGATTDAVGISFGGATGPENSYLLDGFNTTDGGYGLMGTPLTLEFLEETNIITAGYRAEYGRATGGVVSLVTKSGSNEVKGSIWFNGQGLLLEASPIARLGEAIASSSNSNQRILDFGFELGGPLVRDHVWFFAGVAPTLVRDGYVRSIRSRVAREPALVEPGQPYAGDLSSEEACPPWTADQAGAGSALCSGPGAAAGAALPASGHATEAACRVRDPDDPSRCLEYETQSFESDARLINYIAKLDLRLSDDHRASVSYVGSPSTFGGVLDNSWNPNPLTSNGFNSDPEIGYFTENIQVHDVVGQLRSKLLDRRLDVRLTTGFHSQSDELMPRAQGAGSVVDTREVPLVTYEAVPGCTPREIMARDGSTTMFDPCPVSSYQSNGFGFFDELRNERFGIALDLTYFAEAAGTHALKLGGDYENNRYRHHRSYTGGSTGGVFNVYSDGTDRLQFGTVGADGQVLLTPNGFTSDTRTHNEAVYLQDSWSTSLIPGLTVDLGLRWELQQLRDADGRTAFSIDDNISPRVGLIYDWTEVGGAKLFANYGRYYESIPLDINDRSFSREAVVYQFMTADQEGYCQSDANGKVLADTCRFPQPAREDAYGGELAYVQPDIGGQYSDQVTAGLELDVGRDLVIGAAYIHKALGEVIEDVSPDGGNTYLIANPGAGVDPEVLAELRTRVARASTAVADATDDVGRAAAEGELAAARALLDNYEGLADFPEATRYYNALQLTARKRFSDNFQLLASYTYSRTYGNYPGLYQSSNGQLDPNVSTQFDLEDLLANRDGPLPSDRPHNVKLAGSYFLPLGRSDEEGVTVGVVFNAISGRPIEVLGRHPLYGRLETFILPRGSGGRTPWVTSLDLRIGYTKALGDGYLLDVAWDTFNVLDQRAVTAVDEEYTTDAVDPIANGTAEDLAVLKTTTGGFASRQPSYGRATAHQAPIAMRLGARLRF